MDKKDGKDKMNNMDKMDKMNKMDIIDSNYRYRYLYRSNGQNYTIWTIMNKIWKNQ